MTNPLITPLRHRIITVLLIILITVLCGIGLPSLEIDSGFSSLISSTNPDKPAYDKLVREFGTDSRTLVYVHDPALWSADKLAALQHLHDRLSHIAGVDHIDDLFTVRNIRADNTANGSGVTSGHLIDHLPTQQANIATIRQHALANPLFVGNIISRDGLTTALILSIDAQADHTSDAAVNQAINRALEPARANFQRLFQVGESRINAELRQLLLGDMGLLAPLSALILVVVVLLMLRSITGALIPLITTALSLSWTLGIMGWFHLPLNILCAMLPSLIIVIGSTEDTHMVAGYLRALRSDTPHPRLAAAKVMVHELGVPILLTIATTFIGFASNIFTGMGLIREFAIASSIAIAANGIITMMLVPVILSAIGSKKSAIHQDASAHHGLPGIMVRMFQHANQHYPRLLLLAAALLSGVFLWQAMNLKVTNDPMSYFQQDNPIIAQSTLIHHDLSGMSMFYVSLESKRQLAFQKPENLEKLVEIQQFIAQQGVFDRSTSLADYLMLVNRAFHHGEQRFYHIPKSQALTAQYLMTLHRNTLRPVVSYDFKRAIIVVRHNITDSSTLNSYVAELRQAAVSIAGPSLHVRLLGEGLMINGAAEHLISGQIKSFSVLLIAIFLLMSMMFTSFKGGVIALIPNVIPIILMFGIMGMLGIPLNPGTAMVAVIAMGIAIDNTIHLLARYNDLSRNAASFTDAVRQTVAEEAAPMVTSTLALALGFAVLLKSDFAIIAQFGALAAATMLFALFTNLLITPIVMSRIRLVSLHRMLETFWQQRSLEHSPLFADMSQYQTCKAILISESRKVKAGEYLIQQGVIERCMFVILDGTVEVIRHSNGEAVKLAELGRGDLVGEVGFVHDALRSASVRALTDISVLRFDYERLRTDLKYFPRVMSQLNFNISTILGKRLHAVIQKLGNKKEV
ncbi:MAG: efflux RND transporter permease subunit [Mariprofundales bacterium]|nr:efflux RND transporter permease subunit [Mariprofundales bacterium]